MTTAGWIMMALSWGAIALLAAFCLWKTMKAAPDNLSSTIDVEAELEEHDPHRNGKA